MLMLVASPALASTHTAAEVGVEADVETQPVQANTTAQARAESGNESDSETNTRAESETRAEARAGSNVIALQGQQNAAANAEATLAEVRTTITAQGEARVDLGNGNSGRVMIMPEVAAQTAIERLGINFCSEENNCSIELRAVGDARNNTAGGADSTGETRAAYEVKANKEARMFGLFRVDMPVQAQVDAETGTVIESSKPWWAFLAAEASAEASANAQANAQ